MHSPTDQYREILTEPERLVAVMGDQHGRPSKCSEHLRQFVHQTHICRGVESGEWLVEQHQRGPQAQRPGDTRAPPFSSREMVGPAAEDVPDAKQTSGLVNPLISLALSDSPQSQSQVDVVAHRSPQEHVLLEDIGHVLSRAHVRGEPVLHPRGCGPRLGAPLLR